MIISNGLVEQHIHGAFGVDFMNCTCSELLFVAEELINYGVCAFFPTIMTDDLNIIKDRIALINEAKKKQNDKMAQIVGIHLEGPFINPEKSGIHNKKFILPLDVNLYKKIDHEIIKIITIAPELDKTGNFIDFLKTKNIKISMGHSLCSNLSDCNQVTHLYNAMGAFSHRGNSSVVSALSCENIFCEIIADSMHINDEVLNLTFKLKSPDKIILISDALPLAHSTKTQMIFSGETIYNKNGKLVNKDGVFAGSSLLLCDILKNLADKNILDLETAIKCGSDNILKYHNIKNKLQIYWENNKISKTEFI